MVQTYDGQTFILLGFSLNNPSLPFAPPFRKKDRQAAARPKLAAARNAPWAQRRRRSAPLSVLDCSPHSSTTYLYQPTAMAQFNYVPPPEEQVRSLFCALFYLLEAFRLEENAGRKMEETNEVHRPRKEIQCCSFPQVASIGSAKIYICHSIRSVTNTYFPLPTHLMPHLPTHDMPHTNNEHRRTTPPCSRRPIPTTPDVSPAARPSPSSPRAASRWTPSRPSGPWSTTPKRPTSICASSPTR